MAGTGGARPGAGRPQKREKHAGPIARAEKRIADRLPEVVDRLLELANGVTVQETTPEGEERIYERPPDREAAKYLLDRIMGKPMQRQEHTGADGQALSIRIVYADDDYPDAAAAASGAEDGAA